MSEVLTSNGVVLKPGDVYQEPKTRRLFYVEAVSESEIVAQMMDSPGGRHRTSIERFLSIYNRVGELGAGGSIVWDETADTEETIDS